MAKTYRPKFGEFCWTDAGFKDPAAAKKFYRALLGWKFEDMPMDGGFTYALAGVAGKNFGGLYPQMPEQRKAKQPPYWLPFIAVANLGRTLQKAKAAGGKLCHGPVDVSDFGRMAVMTDPTGPVFALWQARGPAGALPRETPGSACWHDLSTPDTAKAAKFYAQVFGWKIRKMDFSGNAYNLFQLGKSQEGLGGMWPHPLPKHPPAWFTYFAVKSCARAVAKAKALGGRVILGPITVPQTCTFAILRDPQRGSFGVLQPLPGSIA